MAISEARKKELREKRKEDSKKLESKGIFKELKKGKRKK